jgi:carbon starvation protein CstA
MRSSLLPPVFLTISAVSSGFHATQSPIIARTIRNEKDVYGMMIVEGVI